MTTCGHDGYTIRGQCVGCAADLHAAHYLQLRAYVTIADQFRRETGHDPLEQWREFEEWLTRVAG